VSDDGVGDRLADQVAARGVDDRGAVGVVAEEAELDHRGGPREAEHGEVLAALDAAAPELRGRDHGALERVRQRPRGVAAVEHFDTVRTLVLERVHVQGDQGLRAGELRALRPRAERRVVAVVLAGEEGRAAPGAQRFAQDPCVAQGDLGLVEGESRLDVPAAGVVDPRLTVAHPVTRVDRDPHRRRLLVRAGAGTSGRA
jgi:hypothetical protein